MTHVHINSEGSLSGEGVLLDNRHPSWTSRIHLVSGRCFIQRLQLSENSEDIQAREL